MVSIETAAKDFLLACRANGLKPTSIQWYRHMITPFVAYTWGTPVDQVSASDVRRYIVNLRERPTRYTGARQRPEMTGGLSPQSLRDHVTAMKVFFNWCVREYRLDAWSNPMANVRAPRPDRREPKAIDLDDMRRLIDATDDSPAGRRDRAMIAFLADTGCRAGGLLGLPLSSLHLERRYAIVFEKGDRARAVPFTPYTEQQMRLWLDVRPFVETEAVFCSLSGRTPGKALTLSGLHAALKRLKKVAGVTGRVNPHAFRHALARHYLLNGGKIEVLSEIMGHSSINVTQIYARFTDAEIFANHEKFSPISSLKGSR
ncbi:MAG: tyrosine-type recombinase/integrase [Anaerolineae bacterium]|nr:tyrosine-type recombinase/integrase [Anaerolineae bacterium]